MAIFAEGSDDVLGDNGADDLGISLANMLPDKGAYNPLSKRP